LLRLDAIVAFDGVLKAGDTSVLTPEKKNIHKFTALEDTAMLDILVPNYDDTTRFCNFYSELFVDDEDDEEEVKLNAETEINERELKEKIESVLNETKSHFENASEMLKEDKALPQQKSPGEKTTIMYMLPPFDMHVQLLPYEGEPIDKKE
jgi:hypothetical protein